MDFISNALFWISNGLLVPVIILLLLFFVRSLLLVGSSFGQFLNRRKTTERVRKILDDIKANGENRVGELLNGNNHSLFFRYLRAMQQHQNNDIYCERLLTDFEIDADKELSKSKTLQKLGPILGLMGTLIPMGPALVGLSAGDIGSMAYNMQVAFATTVVGLVIGAIGSITQQIKQRWYLQDLINLEYIHKLNHQTAAQ